MSADRIAYCPVYGLLSSFLCPLLAVAGAAACTKTEMNDQATRTLKRERDRYNPWSTERQVVVVVLLVAVRRVQCCTL